MKTLMAALLSLVLFSGCSVPKLFNKKSKNDTLIFSNAHAVEMDEPVVTLSRVVVLEDLVGLPDRVEFNITPTKVIDEPNIPTVTIETEPVVKKIKVSRAHIVYDVPDTIKLFDYDIVTLRLSVIEGDTTVYLGLNNIRGEDTVEVTSVMGANLYDLSPNSDAFTIKELSSSEQVVNNIYYTEWRWSIQPKIKGEHAVRLVLKMRTEHGTIDRPVLDKTIHIYAKPKEVIVDAWWKHWQWLTTTLILPFLAWLYKRRKEKKEEQ